MHFFSAKINLIDFNLNSLSLLHKEANVCSDSVMKEDPICSSKTTHLNSTGFRRNNASMSCHNAAQKLSSKFSSEVPTLSYAAHRVRKATEVSPGTPNRMESTFVSRELPSNSNTSMVSSRLTLKKDTMMELDAVNNTQATGRPVSSPVFVPRETLDSENVALSRKGNASAETVAHNRASSKLHHIRKPSFTGDGSDSQLFVTASRPSSSSTDDVRSMDSCLVPRLRVNGETLRPDEPNSTTCIRNVAKKFERIMSLEQPVGLHNDKGETFFFWVP